MKNSITFVFFLLLTTVVFAAPIDFDNLHVASTSYGRVAGGWTPRLLAAYNNKIYFIVLEDGTTNPSKVYCYNPSNGLSNAVNHTTLAETTGEFVMLRQINNLLYFSDNLGNVYFYDGSTLTAMSGTPFTSSDHVSSIVEFNGLMYFATSTGNIFRHDGVAFEQVGDISEDRYVIDMVPWQKNGYLYVSVGPSKACCPPTGYLIRSSTGDPGSWPMVFSGFRDVWQILPTPDYLYAGVVDTAYSHSSTIRRSSDGTTFPIIYGPDGQYKHPLGSFYYEGIAYFFVNDSGYGFGATIIIDDNGSASSIPNENWALTQAVELNGEVYALAGSYTGYMPGDVYLITTVPELVIEALIDIDPDTLNRKSHGKWITVYITLPDGFDVGTIDTSSIAITSLIGGTCDPDYTQAVDPNFTPQVGDRDEDGIADLTVKFDRQVLLANLCLDDVSITIEGELTTGELFSGSDSIRIIDRGK
jgi:hypothetical protein